MGRGERGTCVEKEHRKEGVFDEGRPYSNKRKKPRELLNPSAGRMEKLPSHPRGKFPPRLSREKKKKISRGGGRAPTQQMAGRQNKTVKTGDNTKKKKDASASVVETTGGVTRKGRGKEVMKRTGLYWVRKRDCLDAEAWSERTVKKISPRLTAKEGGQKRDGIGKEWIIPKPKKNHTSSLDIRKYPPKTS